MIEDRTTIGEPVGSSDVQFQFEPLSEIIRKSFDHDCQEPLDRNSRDKLKFGSSDLQFLIDDDCPAEKVSKKCGRDENDDSESPNAHRQRLHLLHLQSCPILDDVQLKLKHHEAKKKYLTMESKSPSFPNPRVYQLVIGRI